MSRSEYYRISKEQEKEKKELEKEVINCFEKHKGNYGRIRIRKELQAKNVNISEYRIAKILKKNGLISKGGRKRKPRHPKPTEQQYIEENLIKNKFDVTEANYLWCSDITELKCIRSKVYVCGIIDVATRRIVGWSIAKNQTQKLVQDAFKMAIGGEIRTDLQKLYITVTEDVSTRRRKQNSSLRNTVSGKACQDREHRAIISPSKVFGKPSNVRWEISPISHSMRHHEQ